MTVINDYGRLRDQDMPRTERLAHLVALVIQLLSFHNIRPTRRETNERADTTRLVFVVNGHRYLLDVTWPDQPLTSEEVAHGVDQMLERLTLTDDERAALEGDRDALTALAE